MGKAGRAIAMERYSVERAVTMYESYYEEVLAR
jgi:hypothetical protein